MKDVNLEVKKIENIYDELSSFSRMDDIFDHSLLETLPSLLESQSPQTNQYMIALIQYLNELKNIQDTYQLDEVSGVIKNDKKNPVFFPDEDIKNGSMDMVKISAITQWLDTTTKRLSATYDGDTINQLGQLKDDASRLGYLQCRYLVESLLLQRREDINLRDVKKLLNDIMCDVIEVNQSPGADLYVLSASSPEYGYDFCKNLFDQIYELLENGQYQNIHQLHKIFKSNWYDPAIQSRFWDAPLKLSSRMGNFFHSLSQITLYLNLSFLPSRRRVTEFNLKKIRDKSGFLKSSARKDFDNEPSSPKSVGDPPNNSPDPTGKNMSM